MTEAEKKAAADAAPRFGVGPYAEGSRALDYWRERVAFHSFPTIDLDVKFKIHPQRLADIVTTMVESGCSHYWCSGIWLPGKAKNGANFPRSLAAREDEGEFGQWWYASPAFFSLPGFAFIVKDNEEDKEHLVTRAAFLNGLATFARERTVHFADFVCENEDGGTADLLLQFILFGDERYA